MVARALLTLRAEPLKKLGEIKKNLLFYIGLIKHTIKIYKDKNTLKIEPLFLPHPSSISTYFANAYSRLTKAGAHPF